MTFQHGEVIIGVNFEGIDTDQILLTTWSA